MLVSMISKRMCFIIIFIQFFLIAFLFGLVFCRKRYLKRWMSRHRSPRRRDLSRIDMNSVFCPRECICGRTRRVTRSDGGWCSVCRMRFYCSERCQYSDWSNHKTQCEMTVRLRTFINER